MVRSGNKGMSHSGKTKGFRCIKARPCMARGD